MKVRHETPHPDLSWQVHAGMFFETPMGEVLKIEKWSLAGFEWPVDGPECPAAGTLSVPFQGVDVRFPIRIERDEAGNGVLFKDLSGRQRETLHLFYRSILSGRMASSEDMITSLDTPIDLVPMGETETEQKAGDIGAGRRVGRLLWNIVFYLIFAGVVLGFIGGQIIDRLTYLHAESSHVVAPIEYYRSPVAAYVDEILVEVGDSVSQGQTLIEMSTPEMDSDIEAIRVARDAAERRLEDAERRYAQRINRYDAEHQSFVPRLNALELRLQRLIAVRSVYDFFAGRDLRTIYIAQAAIAGLERQITTRLAPLQTDIDEQALRVRDRLQELSRLRRDLGNRKDAADALNIVAMHDGIVEEVFVYPNQFIARGGDALVLEEAEPRVAVGWMPASAVDVLFVGQQADVNLNSGGELIRLGAHISQISAGGDPLRAEEYGVIISFELDEISPEDIRSLLRPNAPLNIKIHRRWAPLEWWEGLWGKHEDSTN
ncbi:HlyD family secretion protein [Cochlodiniinecator piscidefendens]|uniref:HlyD family secretion protein n=1 Tax=Cochlodiniinecator piscidefendens TaxID=2715756 RepID=UPI00140A6492|nr:HlyD family efflux transporter periplasmic adaptor subunit [Cochlodiniinecator piscidefendens]